MLTLRPYQEAAKLAVYEHLRARDDNPCVVIPTAGGKTPVMASICKDAVGLWSGRVLVLAHVKELIEQTADKLRAVCPEIPFGVYSAGLGRRDTSQPVIVAGIQSVYRRACELDAFDLVIVDEAHLIPLDGDGMYRQFLTDARTVNPQVRVVGFTATPYRLKSGSICGPEAILNHICFEVGVRELIRDGYLCPLVTKAGKARADTGGLHVRGGEFVPDEVEDLMDDEALVRSACAEIVEQSRDRNAVLIFASGVRHGRHIVRVLKDRHGIECGFVCGETPVDQRDEVLGRFRGDGGGDLFGKRPLLAAGRRPSQLKYLCNVNVLTTGFDAPNIDCVAMLRPTMSPGLYYQMVGRGFRLHPAKTNCLVLDFGGNILRHGPVDGIKLPDPVRAGPAEAPAKMCPECRAVIAAGYGRCPDCGYEFPPPDRDKHDAKPDEAPILSGQVTDTRYDVRDVRYRVHTKRGAEEFAPRTLRVDYEVGWQHHISEWVCLEHDGYARAKAAAWWRRRSPDPVPETAERAVDIAEAGGLAVTKSITVRRVAGEKFDRIVKWELGPLPEAVGADADQFPSAVADDDEVPF